MRNNEAAIIGTMEKEAKDYADQTKMCIRLSLRNLSYDGNILNVPLYLADELERIIAIALKQK